MTLAACLPAAAQADPANNPAVGLEQDYDPAPAMWRLSDDDTTIYLLGTVHLLPDGFRWRNPQLDTIIDEVDALVLESSDADADASMEQLGPKMAKLSSERRPTSLQLSPAVRERWRQVVELTGQPFEIVDNTPLIVALMGFGLGGHDVGLSSYEHGVETVLAAQFEDSGRPILSIEDTGRVMMSIYLIDDALILPDLERDLYTWDGTMGTEFFADEDAAPDDSAWQMEHDWARGEVQDDIDFGMGDTKLAVVFKRVLLSNRNRRWAQWLDNRLDSPGSILVAVGAGHFEGAGSLLDMLEARGLEAVRINQPAQ
ncbi:hypothetical protein GCM10009127_20370 [Alteraurantiacibacter aestuarii]|uniref:TraB/GumN family protein n=1 Tax=Alteraurantiacibacter aestuarii TaxID=650004 RepID=UPI0031DDA1DD